MLQQTLSCDRRLSRILSFRLVMTHQPCLRSLTRIIEVDIPAQRAIKDKGDRAHASQIQPGIGNPKIPQCQHLGHEDRPGDHRCVVGVEEVARQASELLSFTAVP